MLQSQVVNLNQVVAHLLGMLGRLVKANVELHFHPGQDLHWVEVDPHQIEQVLINLTVNAQDAMPAGGRFTLETRNLRVESNLAAPGEELVPGDYVQIVVRDTGQGMEPAVKARVFEPFFTTKKTGEGTGLGLSMAYGIVKQSGGHLRLESEPGCGCTFWITLPRTQRPDSAAAEVVATSTVPRGSETILLAEDEPEVRELVEGYLRKLGYEVLAAGDGLEAKHQALRHPGSIHLLLSDFVMPRCGGRELACDLAKVFPGLRVIFLSGYPGHGSSATELQHSGLRFLAKPVSLEALARAVREELDR
jgi:CheY-like chemotaxis protein